MGTEPSSRPVFSQQLILSNLFNLSCPLQTLDGEGQKETDNLQLKAPGRDRMDLPGKQCTQLAEDRFDVLAKRPARDPLSSSPRLGFSAVRPVSWVQSGLV